MGLALGIGIGIPFGGKNVSAPVIAFTNEGVDPTLFTIGPPPPSLNVGEIWTLRVGNDVNFSSYTDIPNTVDAGEAAAGQLQYSITGGQKWLKISVNGGPWSNVLTHTYPGASTYYYLGF